MDRNREARSMLSAALLMSLTIAGDLVRHHRPFLLDALTPGAVARLGSARYDDPSEICLSPDGKLIAVLPHYWRRRAGPFINVHDAESGTLLRTLRPPPGGPRSIEQIHFVSPTSLMGTDRTNRYDIHIWNATTGHCVALHREVPFRGAVTAALSSVSDDGEVVVEMDHGMGAVRERTWLVWRTRPLTKGFAIRPAIPTADGWSHLSRNGAVLVTGSPEPRKGEPHDRFVQVWDCTTGQERHRFAAGEGCKSHRFGLNPNGSRLAVGTGCAIRVYDLATGKVAVTIPTDSTKDDVIEYDYSGSRILLARSEVIEVYSATTGGLTGSYARPVYRGHHRREPIRQIVFSPDGKGRVLDDALAAEVWDLETGRPFGPCRGHGEPVERLRYTIEGESLISTDSSGRTLTWDVKQRRSLDRRPVRSTLTENEQGAVKIHENRIYRWELEENDSWSLVVRDRTTLEESSRIPTRKGMSPEQHSLTFSPTGRTLFLSDVGPEWSESAIYDIESGQRVVSGLSGKPCVVASGFSPDASRLVLAVRHLEDEIHRLELVAIDTKTGNAMRRVHVPGTNAVVQILPDNRTAVAVVDQRDGWNCSVRTWDMQTGRVLRTWDSDSCLAHIVPQLSCDGTLLVFATIGGDDLLCTLRIVDTSTLDERVRYVWPWAATFGARVAPEDPYSLAISPNNKTLAAGLTNGTIVLYDIPPKAN